MAGLPPQRAERAALCDLFLAVGPSAPTLCEGWLTADLAAHLVIRERNPLAGPGLVMGGAAAALTARILARTKAAHTYEELVARVRRGPPPWTAPFDAVINLTEYFVHHEDVRRGGGDDTPRRGPEVAPVEAALWKSLRRSAKFLTRSLKGTGLDLVRPDGEVIHARPGPTPATLTGTAGEIVLFLTGRTAAARVELGGPAEAVAALRAARFGL
ncbi:MAG TPA: TIGR03085 family metal-binding protein [Acidimicrobiales bacterium]|nr:TIGR03085 family metal-binding protein [Acidimicrobiales bacterium]